MSGWIKLHRAMTEWEWRRDLPVYRIFMELLITANYEPSRFEGYTIPVGSLVTGRKSLSVITGLTEQQVRTSLNKLISTNEITIKTTNKFSIISIVNWSKYQGDNQETNQPITNDQPTINQRITTSKESKKERREEVVGALAAPETAPASLPEKQKRARRLKDEIPELEIPEEWGQWAYDELSLTETEINFEWEKFRDYWQSIAGQKGCKLDWPATWRNWCRKKFEDKKRKEELNGLYRKK